jgi:hypothetical protein
MFGELPASLDGTNSGQSAVKGILRLPPMVQLQGMPANFTLRGPRSECMAAADPASAPSFLQALRQIGQGSIAGPSQRLCPASPAITLGLWAFTPSSPRPPALLPSPMLTLRPSSCAPPHALPPVSHRLQAVLLEQVRRVRRRR